MALSIILLAGIIYCLYKFFRGAWWADQAIVGASLPAMIVFAATAGSMAVPFVACAVLAMLIALPSAIRY